MNKVKKPKPWRERTYGQQIAYMNKVDDAEHLKRKSYIHCIVCGKLLHGRQRMYCSRRCRKLSDKRRRKHEFVSDRKRRWKEKMIMEGKWKDSKWRKEQKIKEEKLNKFRRHLRRLAHKMDAEP